MHSTTGLLGYCQPLRLHGGETTALKISSNGPRHCSVGIFRIVCGDIDPNGPGASYEEMPWGSADNLVVQNQAVNAGSCAIVQKTLGLGDGATIRVSLNIFPTMPLGKEQVIFHWGDISLVLNAAGQISARAGGTVVMTDQPVLKRRWYRLEMVANRKNEKLSLDVRMSEAVAGHAAHENLTAPLTALNTPGDTDPMVFAARFDRLENGRLFTRDHYNGKIERPTISHTDENSAVMEWDFSKDQSGVTAVDIGSGGHHLTLVNTPMRACSGHNWDSSVESWQEDPSQYGAIHFHDDDMTDCYWETSVNITPPKDAPSGYYIARLTAPGVQSDVPFFVSVLPAKPKAGILLIAPTATYLSYANTHIKFDSHNTENLFEAPIAISEDELYLNSHRELGLSHYDTHSDDSGVIYVSERRPMLNFRPGLYTFNYVNDTHLTKWLEAKGFAYDVTTDEDLHRYGRSLLDSYQVVITASHPEYYSTEMWDALFGYQHHGGHHMYLGGNGFYWRVAWSDEHPGVVENRRGAAGVRTWEGEPGEHHLSFSGEPGGLWRTHGRAPQSLVGNGFSSTLFVRSTWFRRSEMSRNADLDFIFAGLNSDIIGDFGYRGGGSVGLEIDRWDPDLGSPPGSVVLATSEYASAGALLSGEEFITTTRALDGVQNGKVRADMVFFKTPGGGAVWSTGSIAWITSLMWNNGDNSVSTITENVLTRFLED